MSETGEGSRIRLALRPIGVDADNPGLAFWNKLTPDRQRILAGPIREAEIAIAESYPDGFKSSLVDRINQLENKNGLERQLDSVSCTYHAAANALRILDEPRSEYSKDQLQARIEALTGHRQTTISRTDLEKIFASGNPYDRFITRIVGKLQLRIGKAPEMSALFQALAQGAVGVAYWFKEPGAVTRGSVGSGRIPEIISHARTIVGFEKGSDNSLKIHVVDPYGARHETWSFRDWYVGLQMRVFGNERGFSDENITNYAARMRERGVPGSTSVTAAGVWLIEKKRLPIVIKKPV